MLTKIEALGYLVGLYESLGDSHRTYFGRSLEAFEWAEIKDGKELMSKAGACIEQRGTIADIVEDLYDLKL